MLGNHRRGKQIVGRQCLDIRHAKKQAFSLSKRIGRRKTNMIILFFVIRILCRIFFLHQKICCCCFLFLMSLSSRFP